MSRNIILNLLNILVFILFYNDLAYCDDTEIDYSNSASIILREIMNTPKYPYPKVLINIIKSCENINHELNSTVILKRNANCRDKIFEKIKPSDNLTNVEKFEVVCNLYTRADRSGHCFDDIINEIEKSECHDDPHGLFNLTRSHLNFICKNTKLSIEQMDIKEVYGRDKIRFKCYNSTVEKSVFDCVTHFNNNSIFKKDDSFECKVFTVAKNCLYQNYVEKCSETKNFFTKFLKVVDDNICRNIKGTETDLIETEIPSANGTGIFKAKGDKIKNSAKNILSSHIFTFLTLCSIIISIKFVI